MSEKLPEKSPLSKPPAFELTVDDPLAVPALKNYARLCSKPEHIRKVTAVIDEFKKYQNQKKT